MPAYYTATAKSGEKVSRGFKSYATGFEPAKQWVGAKIEALNDDWDRMSDTERLVYQNRLILSAVD